jgi:phosphoribosyl 1,2-cyclic phosphate phosphodiesterase
MTTTARVRFLGTGTSHGVPMIGCACAVCQSSDPKDTRLRPSIYLEVPQRAHLLVDTSTDLRQQALAHRVTRVDAVLFTHGHADHVMGFDELRRFNAMKGGALPAYASAETWLSLRQTFHYVFDGQPRAGGGIPAIEPIQIDGPFEVCGLQVTPVPVWHGPWPVLGFRFGAFAYLTDCNRIPDASFDLLRGVETLVLDALRFRPHPTHFTVAEALAAAARVGAVRTYLTHICHDVAHAETSRTLPPGVELAYDGLMLDAEVAIA